VFTPNSDPCDDGNACTRGEQCSAGVCGGGAGCGPCDVCGPLFGCFPQPIAGCRPTLGRSKIVLGDSPFAPRDRVTWTWGKGSATTGADFGDPLAADDYTLCVFDGPNPFPRLLLHATAPAGDDCGSAMSCWTARGAGSSTSGFTYTDRSSLDPDGVKSVKLRAGTDGRARASVKGQGENLEMPSSLDVSLPVTVQLRGRNGACFESKFDSARQSRPDLFRAVSP
jgi:hypothetical protein